MSKLRISPKLALPLDVAGEAIAILAKRGAGKTNTATVVVEELHAAGVQVVVLDPVGAWWGLRSSADGKSEGLPIAILGGQHGDVPLEQTAGALIADVAVDSGEPLLIDLSDLPTKAETSRFVKDFAERLYRRKARSRDVMHLVLEEADVFAPQNPRGGWGGDLGKMTAAIEQIVRRGRSRGLGITMITQRSAVLNKDVLEQTDLLIAMRTTGPKDREAIELWVKGPKGDTSGAEIIDSLPSLETGEAWIWNPEREIRERVRIRRRQTFDSSSTPKAGERRAEPKKQATIDLTALGKEIEATAKRAEASDPRKLQAEVRRLKTELEKRPSEERIVEVEKLVEVPVPVLDGQADQLRDVVRELAAVAGDLGEVGVRIEGVGNGIITALETAAVGAGRTERGRTTVQPPLRREPAEAVARPSARRPAPTADPGSRDTGDGTVSGPQQRILDALAALEAIGVPQADKTQVALFAKASPKSSSFTNNLGHLRNQLSLIDYPAGGRVCLTSEGRGLADAGGAPSTVDELHAFVYSLVGGAKSRLLEVLIAEDGNPITKDELAGRAGASVSSSSFTNNLGSLRSLGLIDYPQPGWVVALPVLFMEGA